MKTNIKTLLAVAAAILTAHFSFAGATEDLWKALKAANDKDALAAIAAGADVNNVDASSTAPLSLAACFSGADVVKALIDAKADINYVQPSNGYTPLFNAANWGNTDAVKLLLAAGADVKPKAKLGQTLLWVAITSVKLDIVKMIVDAGADPLEKSDIAPAKGFTNMNAVAITYSPKEKVANLADNRPGLEKYGLTYPERLVNAKESDFTPLHDIAAYLLSKGLDPNQKVEGSWGCILFQAIEFGKTGVALALIEAKADINNMGMLIGGKEGEKNHYDATPLLVAAAKGDNAVVEALIAAGADVNYVGVQHYGKVTQSTTYTTGGSTTHTEIYNATEYNTALSLASGNKHPETAAIIEKAGGKGPKDLPKPKKKN